MPWRIESVSDIRKDFVLYVQSNGNIRKSCREFGITPRTGYKWLKRYQEGDSLEDRSRKPKRIANVTSNEITQLILGVRENNPSWGGRKIRDYLLKRGNVLLPSYRTCCTILNRNGCISEEESKKHIAYQRFERERPNELWQTDFKGDFLLLDKSRCYPLTILDDHSRYSILIDCKVNTKGVRESFEKAFYEYGLPDSVLSDNGWQFAGFQGGYTGFERWLMEHDILPIHGRVYHPQTQGKIERFHRTMKSELLRSNKFSDINDVQKQMKLWQKKYNEERPHLALKSHCPSEIYTPSLRKYSEKISEYLYDGYVVKVNNWGYLRFSKFQIYLSETMINTRLEISESSTGNSFNVYFRNYQIAEIDCATGKLLNRKIKRC